MLTSEMTIEDTLLKLNEQIKTLKKLGDNTNPLPVAIKMVEDDRMFKINTFSIEKYDINMKYLGKVKNEKELTNAYYFLLTIFDDIKDNITKQHKENIEKLEHNKKVEENIRFIMKTIGVRDNYTTWEYPTKRSKKKKSFTHRAGYLSDLERTFKTNDGFEAFLKNIEKKRVDLKRYYEKKRSEFRKIEQELNQKKKREENILVLGILTMKYKLDVTSDKNSILEHLLNQNKYLLLGYYLEKNRSDWNDGYSYAKYGYDSFAVETEEDKLIEEEILSCINENWDGDGRIFRDIHYNYDYLYDKVSKDNPELFKDFKILKEILE